MICSQADNEAECRQVLLKTACWWLAALQPSCSSQVKSSNVSLLLTSVAATHRINHATQLISSSANATAAQQRYRVHAQHHRFSLSDTAADLSLLAMHRKAPTTAKADWPGTREWPCCTPARLCGQGTAELQHAPKLAAYGTGAG